MLFLSSWNAVDVITLTSFNLSLFSRCTVCYGRVKHGPSQDGRDRTATIAAHHPIRTKEPYPRIVNSCDPVPPGSGCGMDWEEVARDGLRPHHIPMLRCILQDPELTREYFQPFATDVNSGQAWLLATSSEAGTDGHGSQQLHVVRLTRGPLSAAAVAEVTRLIPTEHQQQMPGEGTVGSRCFSL